MLAFKCTPIKVSISLKIVLTNPQKFFLGNTHNMLYIWTFYLCFFRIKFEITLILMVWLFIIVYSKFDQISMIVISLSLKIKLNHFYFQFFLSCLLRTVNSFAFRCFFNFKSWHTLSQSVPAFKHNHSFAFAFLSFSPLCYCWPRVQCFINVVDNISVNIHRAYNNGGAEVIL